jgi:FlaA1/EpsC-like NDP-sugar epimerase
MHQASRRRLITRVTNVRRAVACLALVDTTLVCTAYGIVLLLQHGGDIRAVASSLGTWFIPVAVAATLASNWAFGLYRHMWRRAGVYEARRVLQAGVATTAALIAMAVGYTGAPRVHIVLAASVTITMLVGACRFGARLFAMKRRRAARGGARIIVLGAGVSGAALVRDMIEAPHARLVPVALLDDDPRLQGRLCHGVPVLGPFDRLPEIARRLAADRAVLATPHAPAECVRRVSDLAQQADIPLGVLPPVADLVARPPRLHDLRDLRIEDMLGRKQVHTDLTPVKALLHGRSVLITGAGGSIGAELARQVSAFEPAELLLLDHDETHLHDVCATLGSPALQVLADIRDATAVNRAFRRHRPEIVFHAAAHKHVPVLETHVREAIQTNVMGTRTVIEAATHVEVERFVLVSTDKAVRPSSVMGASKRVAERLVLACAAEGRPYCAVRFGNVIGSRGSVVPTFVRQVAAGGPLTLTDPRMMRYFMTVHEAVQLVLQAAALARHRDLFMLEMGEPVRILDLANRVIRLSGQRVGADIEIRVTGQRPGEKLHEQLVEDAETTEPTAHPAITRVVTDLTAAREIQHAVRLLEETADHDEEAARSLLFAVAEGAPARSQGGTEIRQMSEAVHGAD